MTVLHAAPSQACKSCVVCGCMAQAGMYSQARCVNQLPTVLVLKLDGEPHLQEDRVWAEVVRADVRPLVEEDARLAADAEMRILVQQLKVCLSCLLTLAR